MSINFNDVSVCEYADALPREQFMDYAIHSLWTPSPKISGPAFTVKCQPGDHLMLHAAIYRANPGDVIVVEADDQFAVDAKITKLVDNQRNAFAAGIFQHVADHGGFART